MIQPEEESMHITSMSQIPIQVAQFGPSNCPGHASSWGGATIPIPDLQREPGVEPAL